MRLKQILTHSFSAFVVMTLGLAQAHADDRVTRPSTGPYSQAENPAQKSKVKFTSPSSRAHRGSLKNFKSGRAGTKLRKVKSDEYQLRVKITQTLQEYQGVELICPSGFQDHQRVIKGFVTWSQVPKEECKLQFKGGGPPDFYQGATHGESLLCKSDAQIVTCESVSRKELMAAALQVSSSPLIITLVAPFSHTKLVVTCNGRVLFQERINETKDKEVFSYEISKEVRCEATLKGGGKPYTIQPLHAGIHVTCTRGAAENGKPKSKISPRCDFEEH